jgi:hypothetical protein
VATLGALTVHVSILWFFAAGVPWGKWGWAPRTRVALLGVLVAAGAVAVVVGLLVDDPRDAWSIPFSLSLFVWSSDFLRLLWGRNEERTRDQDSGI